jgi:hypothetical protein
MSEKSIWNDQALEGLLRAFREWEAGDNQYKGILITAVPMLVNLVRKLRSNESPPVAATGLSEEEIQRAIRETEYKYFGDYEMGDEQRAAVETLVKVARATLVNRESPLTASFGDEEERKICKAAEEATLRNQWAIECPDCGSLMPDTKAFVRGVRWILSQLRRGLTLTTKSLSPTDAKDEGNDA